MFLIRKNNLFFAGNNRGLFGKLLGLLNIDSFRWTYKESDAIKYDSIWVASSQASVFRERGQEVTVEMRWK